MIKSKMAGNVKRRTVNFKNFKIETTLKLKGWISNYDSLLLENVKLQSSA